jgi:ankyrin repeat protein
MNKQIELPFYSSYDVHLTDLMLACKYSSYKNNFEIVKKLIENDENIDIYNTFDETAFMIACENIENMDTIKYLINKGANINNKDSYGITTLIKLCIGDNADQCIDVIKYLIKKKANINLKTNFGNTALIFASKFSKSGILVKYLIEQGANINEKNYDGFSVLSHALNCNRIETIKILLDFRVNIYTTFDKKETIFNYVKKKYKINSEIYKLIFSYKFIKNDDWCDFDVNFIYD